MNSSFLRDAPDIPHLTGRMLLVVQQKQGRSMTKTYKNQCYQQCLPEALEGLCDLIKHKDSAAMRRCHRWRGNFKHLVTPVLKSEFIDDAIVQSHEAEMVTVWLVLRLRLKGTGNKVDVKKRKENMNSFQNATNRAIRQLCTIMPGLIVSN